MDYGCLEIISPDLNQMRARRVVSRSRSRPTGKYPSWKMGRMVEWESHNELNAFRLLDADPDASAFHEQPLSIRYTLCGEVRLHVPDVLVECARKLRAARPRCLRPRRKQAWIGVPYRTPSRPVS